MKTLFNTKFNWSFFLLAAFILRLSFVSMSWLSYFSLLISLHHFMLLFNAIGHVIPTRYLLGAFMCVQFFVGPSLMYNGLDQYQYINYRMKVPETVYFTYVIPAVISFIIGLHLRAGKLNGEIVDEKKIDDFVNANPKLPYIFIFLGFIASLLSGYFGSDLTFVFYILGSFKFIGLFLIILGSKKLKVLPLVLVIGSIISSSLGEGMFHDLLTWLIFTGCVFAIKFKFGFNVKLAGCLVFLFLALIIQVLKGRYRSIIGTGKEEAGIETFSRLYEKENDNKSMFDLEKLAPSAIRINQGFIITNIMNTVPDKLPFANGAEMYQIFEAAVLPRILAPNKLSAGDRTIFMRYTGLRLSAGTSMGLSSLGDAYINFGRFGGCIFMFFLGMMYTAILNIFYKKSLTYPILILFTSLVFYYPIRPDCELQTILGHVFKSCFLMYVFIMFFKGVFRVDPASYVRAGRRVSSPI